MINKSLVGINTILVELVFEISTNYSILTQRCRQSSYLFSNLLIIQTT
jgi:hypothetical protein